MFCGLNFFPVPHELSTVVKDHEFVIIRKLNRFSFSHMESVHEFCETAHMLPLVKAFKRKRVRDKSKSKAPFVSQPCRRVYIYMCSVV